MKSLNWIAEIVMRNCYAAVASVVWVVAMVLLGGSMSAAK